MSDLNHPVEMDLTHAQREEARAERIIEIENAYAVAKSLPMRAEFRCAWCGKTGVKRHPAQAFCGPKGKKRRSPCKDRYWNTVDDARRTRAEIYKR